MSLREGYGSRAYVAAVASGREVVDLPAAGGFVLRRRIGETSSTDLVGAYPILDVEDWEAIGADLQRHDSDVSFVAVADPLGPSATQLRRQFPEVCRPYKVHHVADLGPDISSFVHAKHRATVKAASRTVRVELHDDPSSVDEAWIGLYRGLVESKGITGDAAFDAASLVAQLRSPGTDVWSAAVGDTVVAVVLVVRRGDRAYYHLSAASEQGRRVHATHAILWDALHHLRSIGVARFDLGGVPDGPGGAGLSRFKSRWANGESLAHLVGRVLDETRYESLAGEVRDRGSFFPAYRAPREEA